MFMPRALANIVDQVARRAAGKDWNFYAALLEHWPEIVGSDYARATTPVKLTFPHQPNEPRRCNGNLCIRLPKGLAMEFSFKTDVIRQRINTYFGYAAVARITFDPVYEIPEPVAERVKPNAETLAYMRNAARVVENENLRNALESFGEAIATKKE